MKSRFIVALGILGLFPAAAAAQEWEKLGSRVVDFGGDKDSIDCRGEGVFSAIKLDVDDGELVLFDMKVTFQNGDPFSPDTRFEFKQGSMSRTIDLPGDARAIKRIDFNYKSRVKRGKATLTVYGKKAGGGGGKPAEKWEKLGTREVNPKAEKDTIVVTAKEGLFNAIRLDVEGGDLVMYNIKVVFENDEHWSPDSRVHFKEGTLSRTIDLPGKARFIKKVEFAYEGLREGKGRAHIHLFGRHAGGGDSTPVKKDPKDRFAGWEHLGSRIVDFGGDKDTIDCRGEGAFSSFKIEVEEGDLEIYDIVVHFKNGDTVSPKTRLEFDQNTRSRDIDLPGKARIITKIVFFYKSKKGGAVGKAAVHVYGKK